MALSIFFPFLLITCFAVLLVNAYSLYPSYQSCSPYQCNQSLIKYPFNECGITDTILCATNHTTIKVSSYMSGLCSGNRYRVMGGITESSYATRTIRVVCEENPLDACQMPEPPYRSSLNQVNCSECRSEGDLCYYSFYSPFYKMEDESCISQYTFIISNDNSYNNITDENNLLELLHTGFEIKWNISDECTSCENSSGICYNPYYYNNFQACICSDGPHQYNCLDGILLYHEKWQMLSKYKAALGAISGAFVISIIVFIYRRIRRKRKEREQQEERDIRRFMDPLDSRPPSVANFLQAGIPNKYSHRQIKRYTNNFAVKLGQGGFGTVFKGDLANGCIVAIKILDKSKHSQIQFLNEVATIGRIHHLHLVRLLGYCLEGSKRALIYEYMVNGSLEKYIHGDDQNVLNWKQLYSIAMGTARAIAYLHDECRSKILHCDIKPHNVLLDENFSPKVADFGLAKLTDREESHVSLTGARGTPGYVAPEVWSRNYGPITDRSDVYSYGMLVMEMVGGRKNFDMKASRSSKFYYPEWAFKQVEMGEFQNLRGDNITDEEDEIVAKKLSMLGLWCIQYNPSHRPSMSKVIQMLEGTVDITMPPQPFSIDTPVQTAASTESSSSI
ncbi:LEAF RUST 10 DISEASE-RESISTANCE LOCUS RECEPTOR-LIKE PROTEIN KINASE-like 2.4 [Cryptomeria japonica]|uniref:LEAF RUST 10 DISEASE-RESISTANCE LOCUS RECEPTOR-LIKE PROTEIN KINASE-like 2.4 n=1 Tax=Cryptomeria japonica TaxID=3369 RepID=UPI0027DA75A0|nr:LEAF RUST 10 DISEASE-RESISTANCE LOCUS RECEPTOR-LIKE PROTEIN KINASE-like 2.4 [Cryptomeria japonica]